MSGKGFALGSALQHRKLLADLFLFLVALGLTATNSFEHWNRLFYDQLLRYNQSEPVSNVFILAIDQKSLSTLGRWPWPRSLHAEIIDKLSGTGVRSIGYDIIFSEPDTYSPSNDILLKQAIARSGRVTLPLLHESGENGLPLQLTMPLPELAEVAAGLGHIDVNIDSDAIVRSTALNVGIGKPRWPSFSLAVLQVGDWIPPEKYIFSTGHGRIDPSGESFEGLSSRNKVLIPFIGPPGTFPHISCADFLQPDFDTTLLTGSIVLVGATAVGMGDALPTPLSGAHIPMPGVEINANILQMLYSNTAVVPLSRPLSLVLVFLFMVIAVLSFRQKRPYRNLAVFLLLITGTILMSVLLFSRFHLWFGPVILIITLSLSYLFWILQQLEDMTSKIFHQKIQAQVTLNAIGDGVVTLDQDQRILYMNPVASTLSGYSPEQARGKKVDEIFPITNSDGSCHPSQVFHRCFSEKRIIRQCEDGFLKNSRGEQYEVKVFAGPVYKKSGEVYGVVLGISDVSETRKILRQLEHQAGHDALTGLPNRVLLLDRMHQALSRAQRTGKGVAVLFLDLDDFKRVNDHIGHSGGDQLLCKVAQRLLECVRKEDCVSRLGGDEFVILLENLEHMKNVIVVVCNILDALKPAFSIEQQKIFITCSIGVSFFPENGKIPEQLIQFADTAMYKAKDSGKNKFCLFSEDMNDWIQRRLSLEQELRDALANNELQLYYQPQILLRDGRITGVEALLRWQHPERGFVSPADFIPVAEESNLIVPIGEWVLKAACRQAELWQDAGIQNLRLAVNLSPRQFLHGDIQTLLVNTMKTHNLNAIQLELEITEGMIMKDHKHAGNVLKNFKDLGGLVAIDDFGTGYSALSYLKRFPVDQLKIDQSFIRHIAKKGDDAAITQAIITMAHGLNLEVVAEGIEEKEQLTVIKSQGCDCVQGYYFCRPLPPERATRILLSDNHSRCLSE